MNIKIVPATCLDDLNELEVGTLTIFDSNNGCSKDVESWKDIVNIAGKRILDHYEEFQLCTPGTICITRGYNLYAEFIIYTKEGIVSNGYKKAQWYAWISIAKSLMYAKKRGCSSSAFFIQPAIESGIKRLDMVRIIKKAAHFFLKGELDFTILIIFNDMEDERLYNKSAYKIEIDSLMARYKVFDDVEARMLIFKEFIRVEYELESLRLKKIEEEEWEKEKRKKIAFMEEHYKLKNKELIKGEGWESRLLSEWWSMNENTHTRYALKNLHDGLDCGFGRLSLKGEIEKYEMNKANNFNKSIMEEVKKRWDKDSDFYKKANIDRKLFSKINNNMYYIVSKNTAITLVLALELNVEETEKLLNKAGYSLSLGIRRDVIIRLCISNKIYDTLEISMILHDLGEKTLA